MTVQLYTRNETELDFQYWSTSRPLSDDLRISISNADVLLVPQEDFRDYEGPVFPVLTHELFYHLRERVPPGTVVELAVDDADYKELALHADVVRIATVVVKYVLAPVIAILLADYLRTLLGYRFGSAEVRASIIVDQSDPRGRKATQISYEGPAGTFENTVKGAIKNLSHDDSASSKN